MEMKIKTVRETICNAGLIILVVITLPALAVSLIRIPTVGWQPIMGVHIVAVSLVVLLAIFRNRFSYNVRATAIVALIFSVGAGELFNFGIIGAGGAYLVHASIIAAILLSRKQSIYIFAVCSFLVLLAFLTYKTDTINIDLDLSPYLKDAGSWGNFYFDYLLIYVTTLAAFHCIYGALIRSVKELEKHNSTLEDQVAIRTAELVEENKRTESALVAEREAVKNNLNFIDMISHEYRTPLSVITSSLDLLRNDLDHDRNEATQAILGRMSVSAARLLGLFELALNEKRIRASNVVLSPTKIDLVDEVINVAADFTRHIYRDHHIVVDDSKWYDTPLSMDRDLMVTAFSNILDNACKYSEPSRVTILLKTQSDAASIEVSDAGVGVPERDLEHVFEKYYRSESTGNKPGAGVGLYLIKKIVELHQGHVSLTSKQFDGTTVRVHLPIRN